MNIAIVNDVFMIRMLLARIIHENSEHKVIWDAEDGEIAVRKAQQDTPDLILMDLFMPVMNGVDATREIMKNSPCAIVVVTASVDQNADMVFSAMSYGALDAISTPSLAPDSGSEGIEPLLHKLSVINNLIVIRPRDKKQEQPSIEKANTPTKESYPMTAQGIGSSKTTGFCVRRRADRPDRWAGPRPLGTQSRCGDPPDRQDGCAPAFSPPAG